MSKRIPFEDLYIPEPNSGCWLWLGHVKRDGYGQIRYEGKQTRAHIASYKMYKGPTNGLFVCHKCDQRSCVNPDHLFLGTPSDNTQDCIKKGRFNRPKGENHVNAILTKEIVLEIVNSTCRRKIMAMKYNISEAYVSSLRKKRKWKHLFEN